MNIVRYLLRARIVRARFTERFDDVLQDPQVCFRRGVVGHWEFVGGPGDLKIVNRVHVQAVISSLKQL